MATKAKFRSWRTFGEDRSAYPRSKLYVKRKEQYKCYLAWVICLGVEKKKAEEEEER